MNSQMVISFLSNLEYRRYFGKYYIRVSIHSEATLGIVVSFTIEKILRPGGEVVLSETYDLDCDRHTWEDRFERAVEEITESEDEEFRLEEWRFRYYYDLDQLDFEEVFLKVAPGEREASMDIPYIGLTIPTEHDGIFLTFVHMHMTLDEKAKSGILCDFDDEEQTEDLYEVSGEESEDSVMHNMLVQKGKRVLEQCEMLKSAIEDLRSEVKEYVVIRDAWSMLFGDPDLSQHSDYTEFIECMELDLSMITDEVVDAVNELELE